MREICVMHANTSLQSRLSYSVILKNRYLFAQKQIYMYWDMYKEYWIFYMPIVYYMLLLYVQMSESTIQAFKI